MKVFVVVFRRILGFYTGTSVLAWSATKRLLAVLPVLVLLWLAVLWASLEAAPL